MNDFSFPHDFGSKCALVYASPDDFSTPIRKHMVGLGFTLPEEGKPLEDPGIFFIFDNPHAMQQVFQIFDHWCGPEQDGKALVLTIVIEKDGNYRLNIWRNEKHAVSRFLPDHLLPFVTPIYVGMRHSKAMQGPSRNLERFQQVHQSGDVFIAPALASGKVFLDLRISGVPLQIFKEEGSPNETINALLLPEAGPETPEVNAAERMPAAVLERRRKALRHFFPLTMTRLRFDGAYQELRRQLQHRGYSGWQVDQAACVLTLSQRLSEDQQTDLGDRPDAVEVLRLLDDMKETITDHPPVQWEMGGLTQQIQLAACEFVKWLQPETENIAPEAAQAFLSMHGYLKGA